MELQKYFAKTLSVVITWESLLMAVKDTLMFFILFV